MWTYQIKNGWLDQRGVLVSKSCYSGHGEGLNNPALQNEPNIGPIPQGLWEISGPPFTHPERGPYVLRLTPRKGTETFGRSGFLIHGDEVAHPGEHLASHGCVVADRVTRERLYQSGDPDFMVVSGLQADES